MAFDRKKHEAYSKQAEKNIQEMKASIEESKKRIQDEWALIKILRERDRIRDARSTLLYRELGIVPPQERN